MSERDEIQFHTVATSQKWYHYTRDCNFNKCRQIVKKFFRRQTLQ